MNAVPVSVALVAGGLAVVNPCGFPLLPAFLSFYLGADEHELPRAPTRILQGLLVGVLVSAGFLGLFALASLPGQLRRCPRCPRHPLGRARNRSAACTRRCGRAGRPPDRTPRAPAHPGQAGTTTRRDAALRGRLRSRLARLHTAALPDTDRRLQRRRQADRVRRLRRRHRGRTDRSERAGRTRTRRRRQGGTTGAPVPSVGSPGCYL